MVGGVIMVHGDEFGLKLPPRLAPIQVVLVPIARDDESRSKVMEAVDKLTLALEDLGVRTEVDTREGMSPGFKFNHWEVRGVPVRLECGMRDLEAGHIMVSPRNKPGREGKFTIPLDSTAERIHGLLDTIQDEMLAEALKKKRESTFEVDSLEEFKKAILEQPGFYSVWWAGDSDDEARLQELTKATIRCIPTEQPGGTGKCFMTGKETSMKVIVARAY